MFGYDSLSRLRSPVLSLRKERDIFYFVEISQASREDIFFFSLEC